MLAGSLQTGGETVPRADLCVVVICKDGHRLDSVLASVLRHAGGTALDLVLVAAGNGDSTEDLERRFPDVRLIRCPDCSPGHVKNRALETTNARYVLLLDDVEILEGSVGGLIARLDQRPTVGLVGGRQFCPDGTPIPSAKRFPPRLRLFGRRNFDASQYDRELSCDWTSGFMLVRSAALESIGWFDERFSSAEELDFCWRLKRAGWEVLHAPGITVRRHDRGSRENARTEARSVLARMQFARKHYPLVAAEYRWALALGYALQVGVFSLLRRPYRGRREAARTALATVLKGRIPYDEQSAP
jgi:GT2 family glycosyltransferase